MPDIQRLFVSPSLCTHICSRSPVSLLFKWALFFFPCFIHPSPQRGSVQGLTFSAFSLKFYHFSSLEKHFPLPHILQQLPFHSIPANTYIQKQPRADPTSAAAAVLKESKRALYFLPLSNNSLSCKLQYKTFLEVARRFPERLQQSWQNLRLLCRDLGDNRDGTRSFLPSDRNFGCTAVALIATKGEPARDHPAGLCLIWDEQGKYGFSPLQTNLFVKWYPSQQISLYCQSALIIQVYLCMCREKKTDGNAFWALQGGASQHPLLWVRFSCDSTVLHFETAIKMRKFRLFHLGWDSPESSVRYRGGNCTLMCRVKLFAPGRGASLGRRCLLTAAPPSMAQPGWEPLTQPKKSCQEIKMWAKS